MGIFDKFKVGFKKSASALTSGIREIIIKKEIDDKNLDKLEEFLIQSDVGVEAASEIKEIISTKKIDPKKDLSAEINLILKEYIISLGWDPTSVEFIPNFVSENRIPKKLERSIFFYVND